jgi:hypothetical protein
MDKKPNEESLVKYKNYLPERKVILKRRLKLPC